MIYFDNAATTFPKPPSVRREVERCMRDYCGNPGRSAHALSLAAAEAIYACRVEAADLLGVSDPEQIIFTYNTTHALNMAIKGLLHRGDHVLISDMEHNAVYRPIRTLAEYGEISYNIYPTYPDTSAPDAGAILAEIAARVRPETRMVIASHISNLCGAALPIAEIGEFCHARGLFFVVDAAQSAGMAEIDCSAMQIDALCAPGHKGLYGPQGTGILALRKGLTLATLIEGGTGINSLAWAMPDLSPERHEAGTLATPAIAGLCAGIRFVRERGIDTIRSVEHGLYRRLFEQLSSLDGVTVYAPAREGSTLLFNLDGIPSTTAAAALDDAGICLRAGFHCAPLGHTTLRTGENGALRVGFSVFNRAEEVDVLVRQVKKLLRDH